MVDKVLGWIRNLTEVGLALIALGVVLQVILVLQFHSLVLTLLDQLLLLSANLVQKVL